MLIVHVFVRVKPEALEAFREATLANARNSVLEPGIARFDVIQQADDPTRFVLVEVYRTVEDTVRHRGNRPLRRVARRRSRHDGRAASSSNTKTSTRMTRGR